MVVEILIRGQGLVGIGHGKVAVVEIPELGLRSVVSSLHAAVELRGRGGGCGDSDKPARSPRGTRCRHRLGRR